MLEAVLLTILTRILANIVLLTTTFLQILINAHQATGNINALRGRALRRALLGLETLRPLVAPLLCSGCHSPGPLGF